MNNKKMGCKDVLYGALYGSIAGAENEKYTTGDREIILPCGEGQLTGNAVMMFGVMKACTDFVCDKGNDIFDSVLDEKEEIGFMKYIQVNLMLMCKSYANKSYPDMFTKWLVRQVPCGYGGIDISCALRAIPIAWVTNNDSVAMQLAKLQACVTDNTQEGIRGAQAVVKAILDRRKGKSASKTLDEIEKWFGYHEVKENISTIKASAKKYNTCDRVVPLGIICGVSNKEYYEVLNKAVSLSGNVEATTMIAGAISSAKCNMDKRCIKTVNDTLTCELFDKLSEYNSVFHMKYMYDTVH